MRGPGGTQRLSVCHLVFVFVDNLASYRCLPYGCDAIVYILALLLAFSVLCFPSLTRCMMLYP